MSLASPVLDNPMLENLPYVEAVLNYMVPMAERAIYYTYEPSPGILRDNVTYNPLTLPIRNARSIVRDLSVDHQGFALVEQQSSVRNFYDEDEIRRIYYPEAEQFLKDLTGATKVLVFDHNVRSAPRAAQGKDNAHEPVKRVHNDFTAKSGYTRARLSLAAHGIDDADTLLRQRFAVVNIWRSIAGPVQESPLAVCDAQTIAPADLVVRDLLYRDRVGETYSITYNPAHRWFYFPHMQTNEVLLIKCFDSAEDGRARFAAHTAFDDPTSPPNAPARESIELRTLIFYPDAG